MIRTLIKGAFLILGLILGLGLAVVLEGRAAHLQRPGADPGPVWLGDLEGSSGVLQGQADQDGATLRWSFERISLSGPLYRLTAQNRAGEPDGEAQARLLFLSRRLDITNSTLPPLWQNWLEQRFTTRQ